MPSFVGSNLSETITPGTVSPSVTVLPLFGAPRPGAGADTLAGGGGNDTLDGGGGADSLNGGTGNDWITVRTGGSFDGADGDDRFDASSVGAGTTIAGGSGSFDALEAQGSLDLSGATLSGIESLGFASASDTITLTGEQLGMFQTVRSATGTFATGGHLVLTSAAPYTVYGNVRQLETLDITGSTGADDLYFTSGSSIEVQLTARLGLGNDTMLAGGGNDSLYGEAGNDSLVSSDGGDRFVGGGGSDTLVSQSGDDTLLGGNGADLLVGGAGRDRLTGGAQRDQFAFDLPSEGDDVVADFVRGEDLLRFDASGFGGGLVAGPLPAGRLVVHASGAATAPAGQGQFVFNTGTSMLLWDADGSGGAAATKVARLTGVTGLSTDDFLLIA